MSERPSAPPARQDATPACCEPPADEAQDGAADTRPPDPPAGLVVLEVPPGEACGPDGCC